MNRCPSQQQLEEMDLAGCSCLGQLTATIYLNQSPASQSHPLGVLGGRSRDTGRWGGGFIGLARLTGKGF
jgi:hypothetical protein